LTGPARELVATRLDLWLKTHIEKLLAPLFTLSAADDITGMARGVAFQLVEALGVLERQKVAEEVKGLDQPSRATLRKYGVRFGAYHIYLPALLKPAPRALATQLWALKHEAPDAHGVTELLQLAGSGRTSIPIDKDTPKPLYRTAGYRVAGERAVRVDILERLADLIRPALSWREGVQTPKPDGAFDGRGFTVTGAMTSLTGASGEDFASILRSLGYRLDRRPKPPEVKPEPTAAEPAEVTAAPTEEVSAAPSGEVAAEPIAEPAPEPAPVASSLDLLPATDFVPAAPAAEPPPPPPPAQEENIQKNGLNSAEQTAVVAEKPADELVFVDVWRPAGRSEKRPPRARRPQRAAQAPVVAANGDATAAPVETATADTAKTFSPDRPPRTDRKEGPNRQQRQERHERQQRVERQSKGLDRKAGGPPRGDRPRRDKGDRVEKAERDQYYAKPHGSSGGSDRNKAPDPNSPFAKLAALKQQLEQNNKP